MRTQDLRINQLSPEAYEWYIAYLTAIDGKGLEAYGVFLADDCVSQTNNDPPVRGKAAILEGLSYYWTTFDSLTQDLLNIYGTDSSFVLEALNHHERKSGEPVTLRAVAFTDRNEAGLANSVRLYTDTTPLFAPAG